MNAPRRPRLDRRTLLRAGLTGASTLAIAGCEPFSEQPWFKNALGVAESLSFATQRTLLRREGLAQEYSEADISNEFRANGSTDPQDEDYRLLAASRLADWRLVVDGLVEHPLRLSLGDLRAMLSRTRITRHDCVEGWSCIGKWTGVRLRAVLDQAALKPEARFIVFYCFDTMDEENSSLQGSPRYYESVDLVDAAHLQTILAYEMNGQPLPIAHGAPLRLRVGRQLGYKMAKYLLRVEAVESFTHIGGGRGGYWEDRNYEWYAGI
jgi:DMSO/TMAO reductase YedYZ molybdopterin-dependent catalytic subunit